MSSDTRDDHCGDEGISVFYYRDMVFVFCGKKQRLSLQSKCRIDDLLKRFYSSENSTDAKLKTQLIWNRLHLSGKEQGKKMISIVTDAWHKKYPKFKNRLTATWRQKSSSEKKVKGNRVVLSFFLE